MGKIKSAVIITGVKDNIYYWRPSNKLMNKIKIHINGFGDLHRQFRKCSKCCGAYQSKEVLQQHILKYHYQYKKKTNTSIPSKLIPSSSVVSAVPSASRKQSTQQQSPQPKKKRQLSPDTDDDVIKIDSTSNSDDDSDSDDDRGVLAPNSDYSDEDNRSLSTNEEMKRWLARNLEPISELLDYASKTYDIRSKDRDRLTIKEFITQWPLYFRPKGLFEYDFKKRQTNAEYLQMAWPDLSDRLIMTSGGEAMCKSVLGINLALLTREQRWIACMMLLPNLIKNPKSRGSKEYFSSLESRNAFIRVFDPDKQKKQVIMKPADQPHVLITGKMSMMKFTNFSVVMDGHTFPFNNFLQAMDCCFKCYFLFNVEYPTAAEQIWCFLGSLVFNMNVSGKRLTQKTIRLMESLIS